MAMNSVTEIAYSRQATMMLPYLQRVELRKVASYDATSSVISIGVDLIKNANIVFEPEAVGHCNS
jgi:hypothetical protein